jgi:hypothetical protein
MVVMRMLGGRAVVMGLLVAALGARPAGATILVPMSDEDLVATSDVIVVGTVTALATALLAEGRVVTRITLGVERALKGSPGASLVVTEPGGTIGGRAVVVQGAPEWVRGERALVFLRVRRDGSLSTNALALGKYRIEDDPAGAGIARRTLPTADVRRLEAFTTEIAALAARGTGAATNGRAGAAVAAAELVATSEAFTLSSPGGFPGRWFEADCGLPVAFSIANVEETAGDAASRAGLDQAAAAWSAIDGASLVLAAGPDTTPAPSLIGGTFDGRTTVLFNDPFGEVEDLVGCNGVVARGGFVASADDTFPGLQKTVGDRTFGRIFEGDVTFAQGFGACFADPLMLTEVMGHEIGHAIGFGHSSENPAEPDPVLAEALMYFRAHDDGRGAAPMADDIAAMTAVYPAELLAATPLASLACEFDLGILAHSCFGQSLSLAPFNRFEKARLAAGRAASATVLRKQKKQLKKALTQLKRTDQAIVAGITGVECRDAMRATVARLREKAAALRASL